VPIHGRRRNRKIDTNPLLPFTYDDILYIISVDKNNASGVASNNTGGKMQRRVSARSTPTSYSSVPAPDMGREQSVELRELKALEIAARSKITFDGKAWVVPSQTSAGKSYRCTFGDSLSCSCEDFALTNKACKHIIAARLVCERDYDGAAPPMDTTVVPKRPTYRQNWKAYNEAQITEKHRPQVLLAELCRTIPEPARSAGKPGRLRTPFSDQVFACAYKVYSTFSARRFGSDLRDAFDKGYMTQTMHPNKLCTFLDDEALTPILHDCIVRTSLPLRAVETVFAPDSTGFSTSRFVRWFDEKYGTARSGRDWVKAHIMTGTKTNVVTAVIIEDKYANDSPQFKPLVDATAGSGFAIKEVPADKAYLSRENLELLHGMGGTAYVPFKSNSIAGEAGSLWERMYFYYQFKREEFLKHYHQRSNVESTFSMVKAKFRDHVGSKTDTAMKNEVLCKFLCHNLCVLIQSQCELGIEPVFWQNDEMSESNPDVLPMTRPG
jgi:transposase